MLLPVLVWLLVTLAAGFTVYAVWQRTRTSTIGSFIHPSGFSQDLYRPLLTLLDDEEVEYLQQQPGCTEEIAQNLRRQRRLVFRGYLKALRHDFHVLDRAAHFLILQSSGDRSDLIVQLRRMRMVFYRQMFLLECAVLLHRWRWAATPALESVRACVGYRELIAQLQTPLSPLA